MQRFLAELPAVTDGLSATERAVLQAIAAGAHTPPAVFLATQDLEPAPFHGDSWLYRVLVGLGVGQARLVETDAGGELPAAPPPGDADAFAGLRVRLSRTGEQVLAGQADRVELLGVDRWVGGTHVTPGNLWRWDAAAGQLVPPR